MAIREASAYCSAPPCPLSPKTTKLNGPVPAVLKQQFPGLLIDSPSASTEYGTAGFDGDGGPATAANLFSPTRVAEDVEGNLFISDGYRIRKLTFSREAVFSIVSGGGISFSTSGTSETTVSGYATIRPDSNNTVPAGLAIFSFRQNNVLVTEAAIPASAALSSARIYAEIAGAVSTGLAIANPNNEDATVSFYFTDGTGKNFGDGTFRVAAKGHMGAFLSEPPFNGPTPLTGSFTFSSSLPVATIALRGFTN